MFQYLGDRDDVDKLISGEQWLSLPEDDEQEVCRGDYILESVPSAFKYALDCEYDHVDVEVEREQFNRELKADAESKANNREKEQQEDNQ
jgi:hypothetical protein